jgi:hypothetical protein
LLLSVSAKTGSRLNVLQIPTQTFAFGFGQHPGATLTLWLLVLLLFLGARGLLSFSIFLKLTGAESHAASCAHAASRETLHSIGTFGTLTPGPIEALAAKRAFGLFGTAEALSGKGTPARLESGLRHRTAAMGAKLDITIRGWAFHASLTAKLVHRALSAGCQRAIDRALAAKRTLHLSESASWQLLLSKRLVLRDEIRVLYTCLELLSLFLKTLLLFLQPLLDKFPDTCTLLGRKFLQERSSLSRLICGKVPTCPLAGTSFFSKRGRNQNDCC